MSPGVPDHSILLANAALEFGPNAREGKNNASGND
ncbi:hypothetical protein SFHH103_02328 [Sinorhizobium fredii HH103]|uniref:Uncharacterized protein n=1 Tax=Sinorhizobium fredii (strain HH103) TaxID=1117943 RepID=G9A993_SINF1|nr:hypothetical protein SFHH103_02328 [Sinorhizobium fredii HH103]